MNNRFYSLLSYISYSYFILPVVFFLIGFVKLWIALPLVLGIFFFLVTADELKSIRKLKINDLQEQIPVILIAGIFAYFWCAFSGIGGFGLQNDDYINNNRTLKDLIERPWPIWYNKTDIDFLKNDVPFCFYIGYYLPASVFGKLTNWPKANLFIFLWSFTQIWIIFIFISGWIKTQIKQPKYYHLIFVCLGFIFFGGLDLILFLIEYPHNMSVPISIPFYLNVVEYDNPYFLIPSFGSDLYWAPHQSIIVWLFMAIFIYKIYNNDSFKLIPLIFATLIIISSWGAVGILVFLTLTLNKYYKTLDYKIIAFSLLIFLVCASYIISNDFKFEYNQYSLLDAHFFKSYVLILFFEVFIYYFFLDFKNFTKTENILAIAIGLIFLLASFFKIGAANDFVQRFTMPSVFILVLFVYKSLFNMATWKKIALVSILIIASTNSFGLIVRSYNYYKIDRNMAVDTFGNYQVKPKFFIEQRLGKPDSFFFKHLAKPNTTK